MAHPYTTLRDRLLHQLARSNKKRAEVAYDWKNPKHRAAFAADYRLRKLTEGRV
jgi:hypothetical protein